jgi:hypothetical protein
MKVFVVYLEIEIGCFTKPWGVFSTREKAEEWVERNADNCEIIELLLDVEPDL